MKEKILIVDDTLLNRELARDLLELEGYCVIEAEKAEEAICEALAQKPDLILMDMVLPDMDGLTATKLLKNNPNTKNIIIVALTAQAEECDQERTMEVGFSGYIAKPIDTEKFPHIIKEILKAGKKIGEL